MKRINVNLFPKSGYVFKDKDGTPHVSQRSWRDLINRLTTYRRINKLPMGDPEREVLDQACERNPGHCYDDQAAPLPTEPVKASIKSAVLSWLNVMRRIRDQLVFVPAEKAAERAEICATCPLNVSLKQGCAPCQTFVKEMRKGILKDRKVDSRLLACEKFSRDTAVMVHLDAVTEKRDDLPDYCWMKQKKP